MEKRAQMMLMERQFEEGETIIREGEAAKEFYLLKEGIAWAFVNDKKVGEIAAGGSQEFIGEVGALLDRPRTASVVAQTKCIVFAVPAKQLANVIVKAPTLGVKLARSLALKLADYMEKTN